MDIDLDLLSIETTVAIANDMAAEITKRYNIARDNIFTPQAKAAYAMETYIMSEHWLFICGFVGAHPDLKLPQINQLD